jgi:hypothetical protein
MMSGHPHTATAAAPAPRTLRFCKTCGCDTPHEIRSGSGVTARICATCLERALRYELDRD